MDHEPFLRVLVVDDDDDVRRITKMIVNRIMPHWEIQMAGDAKAALAVLATFKPDILLIDDLMPGMNGLVLCRYLRRTVEYEQLYIAIQTANRLVENKIAILEAGADDFWIKPMLPADIEDKLIGILNLPY